MERNSTAPIPLTVEEEVKRIFDMFDGNGDGRISISELGAVLKNMGTQASGEALLQIMLELDTDGDGFIDLGEFKSFHCGSRERGDVNNELKAAFEFYDKDKNGKISEIELHSVLRSLGQKCTVQECRRMIGSVDVDGDGYADFEEFKMMMMGREYAAA